VVEVIYAPRDECTGLGASPNEVLFKPRCGRFAMMREAFVAAALGCISMLVPAQTPDPLVKSSMKQATGTIQAVSQSDRHVVLKGAGGAPLVLEVGEDVSNFDQVRPGDRVVVSYYEGLIAEVKPPGGTTQGDVTASREAQEDMPGKASGRVITKTVKVKSVDMARNMLTFETQDGVSRTLGVSDLKSKEFASGLKPGDAVQITYKEAIAVTIQPATG
jgi:hypothetical protein